MSSRSGEFLGHPKGLFVLFFTEMWERFSYYGMRALLMLYMVNYFKWTQEDASNIYKWYTSLVYLTPLLGGYLADRYLGNKKAIIIGAVLMAVGHFLMAFEEHVIFYSALIFLIVGNGFFKPNMSAQVGRLYPANDPRRDSAYTIFYMGINLGAFLSPIVCGYLRENTRWEFHAGFTAAGIGMALGLIVYLLFIKHVEEIPEGVTYSGDDDAAASEDEEGASAHYMTEAEAETTPSVVPNLAASAPTLLAILGVLSVAAAAIFYFAEITSLNNAVALGLGGGFACGMGAWIIGQLKMAVRDRVLAIYVVAIFVVFFWSAFEQAGNAMNVFADKTTERYLTQDPPPPPIYPEVAEDDTPADAGTADANAEPDKTWGEAVFGVFNPVPTEWFQSINALGIFVMAPLFAWLWMYLPRHGIRLSIPAKVAIGVFMQAVAFMLMYGAIQFENKPSSTTLDALPVGVYTRDEGQVVFRDPPDLDLVDKAAFEKFSTDPADYEAKDPAVVHGGRIHFDAEADELRIKGVLADIDRDRILRATVSKEFLLAVRELAVKADKAAAEAGEGAFTAEVPLPNPPEGMDLRYSGIAPDKLKYEDGKLVTSVEIADKDFKSILVGGADPALRNALNELYVASAKYKVSWSWLFWFYILCTIGELCLSPVGLSMVSKLAPAKFATMLMGMWLLTSFFGNFLAGFAGESYGTVHPAEYFVIVAAIVGGAALICMAVVKKTKAMMHGVN